VVQYECLMYHMMKFIGIPQFSNSVQLLKIIVVLFVCTEVNTVFDGKYEGRFKDPDW
jgi:hypothetical protein